MSSSPWVRDVDEATFAAEVVEASRKQPVLVDFWAAWCGPCRMLSPVLEKVAGDLGGAVVVAKIDTDANPNLAMQFQIRGIPACKLFVDGEVVDEFVGAQPEPAVRDFLSRHIKSELDVAVAAAAAARQGGDLERAAELIESAIAESPKHPAALIEGARIALAKRDARLLAERAGAVPLGTDEHDTAQALLAAGDLIRACDEAGGLEAARTAGDAYAVAACQTLDADYQAALDTLLGIVRGDDRARQAMLAIFVLCEDPDLARTYRRKLAIAT